MQTEDARREKTQQTLGDLRKGETFGYHKKGSGKFCISIKIDFAANNDNEIEIYNFREDDLEMLNAKIDVIQVSINNKESLLVYERHD